MLELENLHLEHIMCIDKADIDLNAAIVILEGDNGQGKSAVMEAIAVCFAERKRADSVKEFVQKGYDHAKIILDMKYNTSPIHFNVTLNVRGGTPLERDVEYGGKHYINSEVTALLKELDLSFYSDIILSMQGQDDIATMTPVQRSNLLQRLFQFDFVEKVKSIDSKIGDASDGIKFDNSKIEYLTKELASKKARRDSVTFKEPPFISSTYREKRARQDELLSTLNDIKAVLNDINTLNANLNTYVRNATSIEYALQTLNSKKSTAKAAKAELDNLNYDVQKQQIEDAMKLAAQSLADSENKEADLNKEFEQTVNEGVVCSQGIATCNYKKTVFNKKKTLIAQGVCPECGQSTCNIDHSSLDKDDAENNELIVRYTDDWKASEQKKAAIAGALAQTRRETASFKAIVSEYEGRLNTLDALKKSLESRVMPTDEYVKLEADIEAATDEKMKTDAQIENLTAKINEHKSVIEQQAEVEREYNLLKDELKAFDDAQIYNEAAQKQIDNYNEDISNSELNIEEIKTNAASLAKDIDVYNEVKKVLDKELPTFLIVKTCYKLESEMNTFVQEVFPEFRIRLLQSKRGVEFFYTTDPNNDMEDIKTLINSKMASGYERSILGIAFKVALCRAYGLTFTALDEIDSAASDENSMKTFQSLINSNVFSQMIFITHKEPTKEMIKTLSDDVIAYHVHNGVFTNDIQD